MPDREKVISVLRRYCRWHVSAYQGNYGSDLSSACGDAADLLEDDRERMVVMQNTIDELNKQLEQAGITTTIRRRRRRNGESR